MVGFIFERSPTSKTDSEAGAGLDTDIPDGTRSTTPDPTRMREALDMIHLKIDKIKMDIQREQVTKEDHVNEYLQLSAKAEHDESKSRNIKLVFEKNNQASAQTIAKLQKKLARYQEEAKRIEYHGASGHRPAKDVLKDVGQNIKDFGGSVVGNIRTATDALVSKPKEGNGAKNKSGSVDNISSLAHTASTNGHGGHLTPDGAGSPASPNGSTTLPANFKLCAPSGSDHEAMSGLHEGGVSGSEEGSLPARDSAHNSSASPDIHAYTQAAIIEPLLQKLNRNADSMERLAREVTLLRGQVNDMQEEMISKAVSDEERMNDKYERIEEHLNDFVELTQNELSNLKQEIGNMEEKIDYQLDERTRDLQEALENANTRIAKMELQSQHQQLITMEVDNPNAKMLLTKGINVLLAFLAVILVFVSTISNVIAPFLNARWKVVSLVVFVFAVIFTSSRWEIIADLIESTLFQRRTV